MDKNYMPYAEYNIRCSNCKNEVQIPNCINDDFCIAPPQPRMIENGVLAMAFVDMQPINEVYPEATAFCNGTLFPNLNMPFYGGAQK